MVLSSDSILYSITLSVLFYYPFLKPRIQQMGSGGSELHSPSLPCACHPPIELLYESIKYPNRNKAKQISAVLTNLWLFFIVHIAYSSSVAIWLSKLEYFLGLSEPRQWFWGIGRVGLGVLLKAGFWLKVEGRDNEEQRHILSTFLCQVLIYTHCLISSS